MMGSLQISVFPQRWWELVRFQNDYR